MGPGCLAVVPIPCAERVLGSGLYFRKVNLGGMSSVDYSWRKQASDCVTAEAFAHPRLCFPSLTKKIREEGAPRNYQQTEGEFSSKRGMVGI